MCATGKLFRVALTGQEVWDLYLNSFEEGQDPIFRDPESSAHNCNHCNNFIRRYGNVVALDNNYNILTIFDVIDADEEYVNVMLELSKRIKAYYQSPKGIESSRRAHLKRKYNITLEDYNKLSQVQNHACDICGSPEMNNVNKVLCVDHNHDTGAIRGLLCGLCNTGIGGLKDNKNLLIKAIKYLEKHE